MISLEGMYDIHIHPAPSIQKRRFTATEALRLAEKEKMAGILILDHTYNTGVVASIINGLGLKAKAYGCIMLNEGVGGLNPSVVEIAVSLGTKQIQMPTYSCRHHHQGYGDDQKIFPYKKRATPSYILDDRGRLIPEVEEILELVKGTESFIGTGHLSSPEVDVLTKRCVQLGCKVIVNSVSSDMPGHSLEAQKSWIDDLIFIEHDYMAVTDVPHTTMPVAEMVDQIRTIGAERCVIGSDSGNMGLPDNVEAMKRFIGLLREAGLTEREIDLISRKNTANLLGVS